MKRLVKYKVTLAALIVYLIFFGIFWCQSVDKVEIYVSVFAIITSLYFGLLKHQLSNDDMFLKIFSDFNARYNDDFNDLLNEIRNEDRELQINEKKLVIDYFNLCAEEYLWYKRGRLPKNIWNAWKAGILENLKIKQVFEVYQDEMKTDNERKAYYGLEDEIEKLTINPIL
jgi:hypothetical protein